MREFPKSIPVKEVSERVPVNEIPEPVPALESVNEALTIMATAVLCVGATHTWALAPDYHPVKGPAPDYRPMKAFVPERAPVPILSPERAPFPVQRGLQYPSREDSSPCPVSRDGSSPKAHCRVCSNTRACSSPQPPKKILRGCYMSSA